MEINLHPNSVEAIYVQGLLIFINLMSSLLKYICNYMMSALRTGDTHSLTVHKNIFNLTYGV